MLNWFTRLSEYRKIAFLRMVLGIFFASLFQFGYTMYSNYQHKKEVVQLTMQLKELQEKIVDFQIQLIRCQNDYNLIKAGLDDLPIPAYIVDANSYEVVYVNPAYERIYLIPKELTKFDILGTDGSKAFGKEAVKTFHKHNDEVRRIGKPLTELENVYDNPRDKRKNTKFPIYQLGELTHIGGISYEEF